MTVVTRSPSEVRKPTRSTNVRGLWRTITTTRPQDRAISGAPPAPGSRTLGAPYGPMTVVLMSPRRSISAAPRKPTSMRPGWSQ